MPQFNPAEFLRTVQGGNKYLDVKFRQMWLLNDHPDASVETYMVEIFQPGPTNKFKTMTVLFKATVKIPMRDEEGKYMRDTMGELVYRTYDGYSLQDDSFAGGWVEKGETAAIGRALVNAGFGTQFIEDDGEFIVDSPVATKATGNPTVDTKPKVKPLGKR